MSYVLSSLRFTARPCDTWRIGVTPCLHISVRLSAATLITRWSLMRLVLELQFRPNHFSSYPNHILVSFDAHARETLSRWASESSAFCLFQTLSRYRSIMLSPKPPPTDNFPSSKNKFWFPDYIFFVLLIAYEMCLSGNIYKNFSEISSEFFSCTIFLEFFLIFPISNSKIFSDYFQSFWIFHEF